MEQRPGQPPDPAGAPSREPYPESERDREAQSEDPYSPERGLDDIEHPDSEQEES